jgi:hypothetical protein
LDFGRRIGELLGSHSVLLDVSAIGDVDSAGLGELVILDLYDGWSTGSSPLSRGRLSAIRADAQDDAAFRDSAALRG